MATTIEAKKSLNNFDDQRFFMNTNKCYPVVKSFFLVETDFKIWQKNF